MSEKLRGVLPARKNQLPRSPPSPNKKWKTPAQKEPRLLIRKELAKSRKSISTVFTTQSTFSSTGIIIPSSTLSIKAGLLGKLPPSLNFSGRRRNSREEALRKQLQTFDQPSKRLPQDGSSSSEPRPKKALTKPISEESGSNFPDNQRSTGKSSVEDGESSPREEKSISETLRMS